MDWFRLTLKLSNYGQLPKNGETLLDAFRTVAPEAGPVVSQNTEDGWLMVTIALSAADASEAMKEAVPIFIEGLIKSGLAPLEELELNASPISAEEQAEVRELETA